MTVIELGDVTPGSDQPRAEVPPPYDRRLVRRAGVALLAAACMGGLTASAPPEPSRALRTLWSVPIRVADRFTVTRDGVYTALQDSAGQLTAYDLATGVQRWAITMPEPNAWPTFVPAAGVVLIPYGRVATEVTASDGSTYVNEIYRDTLALDARTGTELWRRAGELYQATDDSVLLTERNADGSELQALRLVRIADGGMVWARAGLHVERATTGGADPVHPDRVVIVAPSGAVEVLRLADGSRLSTGRVAWDADRPDRGIYTDVFVDAARLYVRVVSQRESALTAYTVDTFRQLWRMGGTDAIAAYPCRTLVCGIEPNGFGAHDPATGAIRWRNTHIRNALPAEHGRLVADSGDHWTLVDEATGRLVADLGAGAPVSDADGRATYLVRATTSPLGLSAVIRIDSHTGTAGVRGAIDWVNDGNCQATGDYLVCPTVAGRLVVTLVG